MFDRTGYMLSMTLSAPSCLMKRKRSAVGYMNVPSPTSIQRLSNRACDCVTLTREASSWGCAGGGHKTLRPDSGPQFADRDASAEFSGTERRVVEPEQGAGETLLSRPVLEFEGE